MGMTKASWKKGRGRMVGKNGNREMLILCHWLGESMLWEYIETHSSNIQERQVDSTCVLYINFLFDLCILVLVKVVCITREECFWIVSILTNEMKMLYSIALVKLNSFLPYTLL